MQNFVVKDLMVPISEYATVMRGATLYEAVLALEKAQEEFANNKYSHRAVIVLDENQRVVGKLSQLDFLHALEPRDEQIDRINDLNKFGFSARAITIGREQHRRANPPSQNIYGEVARCKVEDFMQTPSEGEYVEENTGLETAIHQLITGTHLSLLVLTPEKVIVGVLRLGDVFAAVFHAMKSYESTG